MKFSYYIEQIKANIEFATNEDLIELLTIIDNEINNRLELLEILEQID